MHEGEAARCTTIVLRGRIWKTVQEIGISVGAARAVLEGVVECGEKLEPPLAARIVVSHFTDALKRLGIRKNAGFRAPKVASKSIDGPGKAASLKN